MFCGTPAILQADDNLDHELELLPVGSAVFVINVQAGEPYLGKTAMLRRRLKRLLRKPEPLSRSLNLRSLAMSVEYWPIGSHLQGSLVLYQLARKILPDRYLQFLKLRMPSYVRLTSRNNYPLLQVATRISDYGEQHYGPFRTRAAAELFLHECSDLFQLRRCYEDLHPHPEHPGCIYGEIGKCLRPCQEAVTASEYGAEVTQVREFLATQGKSLLQQSSAARERLSREMQFEEAARHHKRIEAIEQVLQLRDDLVSDMEQLHGVAVTASPAAGQIRLSFVLAGTWHRSFDVPVADESAPLDPLLKSVIAELRSDSVPPAKDRQEHLALLARWFYSSWRDGEWIAFRSLDQLPYRRLVNAISRTAKGNCKRKVSGGV